MVIALSIVGMILFVFIMTALLGRWVYKTAAENEAKARERFPHARLILPNVNFFGQKSLGVAQLRGNGTLVVTDELVHFQRWVSPAEFQISRSQIQSIETPRSFLGKTQGVQLLQINYLNEHGEADAMAWRVPDLDALTALLKA